MKSKTVWLLSFLLLLSACSKEQGQLVSLDAKPSSTILTNSSNITPSSTTIIAPEPNPTLSPSVTVTFGNNETIAARAWQTVTAIVVMTESVENQTATIVALTPSPTPSITSTPRPTSTPKPPTITPTINFQATETQQVIDMKATDMASFQISCESFGEYDTSLSPAGNWLAVHCGYNRDQTLEIVHRDGRRWEFEFKDFLLERYISDDGSTPMGGLYPFHWPSDEEYLYFASRIAWDGGGTCFYGFGIHGLFRVNLSTGTVSATLPIGTYGYDIQFSPGGRWLAYDSRQTVIRDLKTGEERFIETSNVATGDLTWSPDGSELAFATCKAQDGYTIIQSTVRIYSLNTETVRIIASVEGAQLGISRYDENGLLKISSTDIWFSETDYAYYDWYSGQLITPSPTTP